MHQLPFCCFSRYKFNCPVAASIKPEKVVNKIICHKDWYVVNYTDNRAKILFSTTLNPIIVKFIGQSVTKITLERYAMLKIKALKMVFR